MNTKVVRIITFFMMIITLSACNNTSSLHTPEPTASQQSNPTVVPSSTPTPEPVDPIEEKIKQMSLEEKIGQLVIVGLDDKSMDSNVERLIHEYKVGGFILFKRNISSADQTIALLNQIKQLNTKSNPIPLFLSVDEEGGRVSRMPDEFIKLPTNLEIGTINNPVFAGKIGSLIAEEISSLGFNMNFAPVLDINSNPDNPVIGNRSYSSDLSIVSNLGVQAVQAISQKNVIPVVKHFPGHGDTTVDSHVGLPVITRSLEELQKFELQPFSYAIEQGAEVVMVSHLLLPEIDADFPASMSSVLIDDVLRRQMGFDGVIVTDDMTMGTIETNFGIGEAVVQSILAGSDIVLICHEYNKEIAAIEALKNAVHTGILTEERIDDSVYRILQLKARYQLADLPITSIDVNAINNEISQVLNSYMPQTK